MEYVILKCKRCGKSWQQDKVSPPFRWCSACSAATYNKTCLTKLKKDQKHKKWFEENLKKRYGEEKALRRKAEKEGIAARIALLKAEQGK